MKNGRYQKQERGQSVIRVFMVFFSVIVSIILGVAITGTQHNIVWYKEAFVSMIWVVSIAILYFTLRAWETWLARYERKILLTVCAVWGIALYAFSCFARNEPIHDYWFVWNGALGLTSGGEVNWWYFARWKNNYFLMLFLAGLIALSNLLGMADAFYPILFVIVFLTIWAGVCLYRILQLAEQPVSLRFFALFLFIGFIPCWAGTQYFYTDVVSLCFGVWGAYVLFSTMKEDFRISRLIYGGIIGGIGFAIKATSMIALIAVVLVAFWVLHKFLKWIQFVVCTVVGVFLVLFLIQFLWMQSPCYEMEYEYKAPLEYWIALGSVNNGGYGANEQFAMECLAASGKEDKQTLAREYIAEHWEELWSMSHWLFKMRNNFASGNMGLSNFIHDPDCVVYKFFNDYGKYGGYMTMFTTGYFYALLLYGVLGSLFFLSGRSDSEKTVDWRICLEVTTALTVFGIFLFLMLWEANNRQLYNHMPWFALLGALGCDRTLRGFRKNKK